MNEYLDEMLKGSGQLKKEMTLNFPLQSGFVPFDLSAPARLLYPIDTPLRNITPRIPGQGAAYRAKIIDGITGSGTGNVLSMNLGFSENQTTVTISLVRPNYISYNAYDQIQTYVTSGLSDSVTFQSAYQGEGFDDVRALSSTQALYASFLGEERLMLYGRGTTANSYVGPLGTPSNITLSAVSASIAPASGTNPNSTTALASTSWVVVAADAGDLVGADGRLHNGPSTVAASVSVTTGQAVKVSVGTDVVGALGYNYYVASVVSGPFFYAGRSGYNVGYISNQPLGGPTTTSGAADASAFSNNYDGFFANTAASGGYVARLNAPLSTTNPGNELQTAFASLWDSVKGSADTVYCNGYDRLQLSNALLSGPNNSSYTVFIDNNQMDNVTVGALVSTITNGVTGRSVSLHCHPWLAQGNMLVRQTQLPLPHANIGATAEMAVVQDYVQLNWPVMGMTYDISTFWISTLAHQAPQWQGLLQGIAPVGVPEYLPSAGDS